MSRIIKGTKQPQRQADEREFVAGVGWTTVEVWDGVRDDANGKADELAATNNYSRILVSSGDNVIHRVRATRAGSEGPGEQDIVDTWELINQSIQEDIFDHPNARGIPASEINSIKEFLADRTLLDSQINGTPVFPTQAANDLWRLVANDKTSYQRSYNVLRHTQTVNTYAQIVASFANQNLLHTRAQLPTTITPAIDTAIGTIPNETPPTGFVFRWLKQGTTITQTFNARPQVVEEWWLYQWSTFVYSSV